MKRKIRYNIAFLSSFITILVAIFMFMTFYKYHVDNQIKSLKNAGEVISNIVLSSNMDGLEKRRVYMGSDLRITLLNLKGEVLFDNYFEDVRKLESHSDRPEIQAAIENNRGEDVRRSSTVNMDNYYYAMRLENDLILRVAHQTETFYSMFSSIWPITALILLLIFILSYYISNLLANNIIRPVKLLTKSLEGDWDGYQEIYVYDEIAPFIATFERQKRIIKDRNRELEERAYLMDIITSNMDEGIILLGTDKKILTINESGIGLFADTNGKEYLGNDFIHLCRDIELNQALDDVLEDRTNREVMIHHNNRYLTIYINTVLTGKDLTGLLLLVVDSTKKHKLDMMRREFSANVSHELKTPLTSIIGYAEMINSGMVKTEDIDKFSARIRQEGVRLLNLIDDIIKLSKIEEGSTEKILEPVDIYSLGQEVINSLRVLAGEKLIDLDIQGSSSFMMGDKGMLHDLLYNLIENSIKYTPSGGRVSLIVEEDKGHTIVRVKDTGIGIPKEHQDRIFERFYTVDKSRSSKNASTGLGLSIVKHIVEYHDGKISLESEVGKGTEISIRFKSIG